MKSIIATKDFDAISAIEELFAKVFDRPISISQINQVSKISDKLIYHVNKTIEIKRLYISDIVIKDILDIDHSAAGYLRFV